MRPRPDGRAAAAEQPADRLHHVPAAEAGGRHREHCGAGQLAGRVRGAHLPVVRVCQRKSGPDRARSDAPRGQHPVSADCDRHGVSTLSRF